MKLSLKNIGHINSSTVKVPPAYIQSLPEKVLQFGTGVLLRALPDYFIDQANRQQVFNGRIVVVKSTSKGDADEFQQQDGLYTVCVRGLQQGQPVSENIINASISRVLSAGSEWPAILACAHSDQLKIIISNTTEVGIQLVNESIHQQPPQSFPAKLLAFLYERYQAFAGKPDAGMIIIPTELIVDNATKLKSILVELCRYNQLPGEFVNWLVTYNRFCNSLVDRIVPGKPSGPALGAIESELGYQDQLLTICEAYRLWAIEGDQSVADCLS